jgi:hypothetical protein
MYCTCDFENHVSMRSMEIGLAGSRKKDRCKSDDTALNFFFSLDRISAHVTSRISARPLTATMTSDASQLKEDPCNVAEIVQFTCSAGRDSASGKTVVIHCFPIPRLFRM